MISSSCFSFHLFPSLLSLLSRDLALLVPSPFLSPLNTRRSLTPRTNDKLMLLRIELSFLLKGFGWLQPSAELYSYRLIRGGHLGQRGQLLRMSDSRRLRLRDLCYAFDADSCGR